MGFGVGIGDCLAIIDLATKVVKEFRGAPKDYRAISDEVKNVLRILEVINRSNPSSTQAVTIENALKALEMVLLDIYGALVNYTTLSAKRSSSGQVKRIWERLKWSKETIDGHRSRLQSCLLALNTLLQELTRSDTAKLVKYTEDKDILEWLGPAEYLAQHADHCRNRAAGTGGWLLESEEFRNWTGMLLLHGIPGTGKTILASTVIDRIKPAYYYCDYTRQERQTLNAILSSLLRQVVSKNPEYIRKLHEEKNCDIEAIKSAILQNVTDSCIVIDALDECEMGCRRELISVLKNLSVKGVRILCTSRPIPDVINSFEHSIEIRASIEDISRYIDQNVPRLPRFVTRVGLVEEIKKAILDAADGIFLLVELHFRTLEGKTSAKALRDQLASLASTYVLAYTRTMQRITDQNVDWRKLAIDALTWVVYAERPLRRLEILHALAIDGSVFYEDAVPDIEDVLEACCGLLIMEQGTEIVRLVHKTTEEFFQDGGSEWLPTPQTKLSDACNNYLATEQLKHGYIEDLLARFPLYKYASLYWESHMNAREQELSSAALARSLEQIQYSSQELVKTMSADYLKLSRERPEIHGLHLAALGGFCDVILALLDDQHVDSVDKFERTPITYAIEGQKSAAVSLLIKNGASLVVNLLGRSLLEYAILVKDWLSVDALLGNGSELICGDGTTILAAGIKSGDLKIVRRLIEAGACMEHPSTSLLMMAVETNSPSIVRLLIEHEVPLETQDTVGRTALFRAMEMYHSSVVRTLLHAGARLDVENYRNQPVFYHYASTWPGFQLEFFFSTFFPCILTGVDELPDYQELSEEILTHVLDVLSRCDLYNTFIFRARQRLLPLALSCGYSDMARRLAAQGSELTLDIAEARVLVTSVAWRSTTRLLAELMKTSSIGTTMATDMIEEAYTVEGPDSILLHIDPHWCRSQGLDQRRFLHNVIKQGNFCTTKLLIDHGWDIKIRDDRGDTVLHRAAEFGWLDIVMYLVELDQQLLYAEDNSGKLSLQRAVVRERTCVVEYLVEKMDPKKTKRFAELLLSYTDEFRSSQCLKRVRELCRERGIVLFKSAKSSTKMTNS